MLPYAPLDFGQTTLFLRPCADVDICWHVFIYMFLPSESESLLFSFCCCWNLSLPLVRSARLSARAHRATCRPSNGGWQQPVSCWKLSLVDIILEIAQDFRHSTSNCNLLETNGHKNCWRIHIMYALQLPHDTNQQSSDWILREGRHVDRLRIRNRVQQTKRRTNKHMRKNLTKAKAYQLHNGCWSSSHGVGKGLNSTSPSLVKKGGSGDSQKSRLAMISLPQWSAMLLTVRLFPSSYRYTRLSSNSSVQAASLNVSTEPWLKQPLICLKNVESRWKQKAHAKQTATHIWAS